MPVGGALPALNISRHGWFTVYLLPVFTTVLSIEQHLGGGFTDGTAGLYQVSAYWIVCGDTDAEAGTQNKTAGWSS